MNKYIFDIQIEIDSNDEKDAASKVESYCRMANLFISKSAQNVKMNFVYQGLNDILPIEEEQSPEELEEANRIWDEWNQKRLKSLN